MPGAEVGNGDTAVDIETEIPTLVERIFQWGIRTVDKRNRRKKQYVRCE